MILFQEYEYPIREIKLPGFGNVMISTTNLSSVLLNENSSYVSEKAQMIDEKIFYYVESEQMELDDKDLKRIILSELL